MTADKLHIIISGGKTGGHLFPGIVVAQAVEKAAPGTQFLFVGTNAPFETQTLHSYGYAHKSISAKPLKGKNIFSKISALFFLGISMFQSFLIIRSFKPDFVFGVGGFSSFAVVLSARLMRIPTAIQEQNAVPGMTNRMLSRFCDTIFTAFKQTKGLKDNPKVKYVGNPVRSAISGSSSPPSELSMFNPGKPTVLATGGSQGAASINKAFFAAISGMENPGQYNIIHQTGLADEKEFQKAYTQKGIKADVLGYINDMPGVQALADVMVARSGAGTVFEICSKGIAAILIPYPYAADDHQTVNAREMEKAGAAVMIKESDLDKETLSHQIKRLLDSEQTRRAMAEQQKKMAMPDAAKNIAAHILGTKEG